MLLRILSWIICFTPNRLTLPKFKLFCFYGEDVKKDLFLQFTISNHIKIMTDSVRKEIENRLETTYHIRVPFENLNENHRVSVIGKSFISCLSRKSRSFQLQL